MKDDWWKAAYYHAYGGKKPTGAVGGWLARIKDDHCGRMSASDGNSLSTDTKKKAPHFDASWDAILNDAIVKGTGHIEDTESEQRTALAEKERGAKKLRDKKRVNELNTVGASFMVRAWLFEDPGDTWEA